MFGQQQLCGEINVMWVQTDCSIRRFSTVTLTFNLKRGVLDSLLQARENLLDLSLQVLHHLLQQPGVLQSSPERHGVLWHGESVKPIHYATQLQYLTQVSHLR